MKPDFSGYASKADVLCSDGRTIKPHAFKADNGKRVPLIWNHFRDEPTNVLGHAVLEDRADGVYAYGYFNKSSAGQHMKEAIKNGDINAMSIFARELIHQGADVIKGKIHEVSLVPAGANPGASIQNVSIAHSSGYNTESDEEAVIYSGESLEHADQEGENVAEKTDKDDRTIADVFDTLDEDQKKAVTYLIEEALQVDPNASDDDDEEDEDDEVEHSDDSGSEEEDDDNPDDNPDDNDNPDEINHSQEENNMSRNVFEQLGDNKAHGATLTHDQLSSIVSGAKKMGSFRESFLEHAATYGFEDIDILFPDAKTIANTPELLSRRMEWVSVLLDGVRHTPFTRIKSIVADITAEEARARGYVKGAMKKEEIVKLLMRKTGPTTIYKKQKLDRDDILDITDLDVVAWLKGEMRIMLDEEIARAILLGDGRSGLSEDKIDEDSIRPVISDVDMYSHKVTIDSNASVSTKLEQMIRARANFRGSASPVFFTTLTFLTDMRLLKDKMGRIIYESNEALASALMASKIVTVEAMEAYPQVVGVYLSLPDYTIGTDKGGKVGYFDDFDIDYNQHKYLMETRMSGALTRPKSAIVVLTEIGELVEPLQPSFDAETNTITIPSVTGVIYTIDDEVVSGTEVIAADTTVAAQPDDGYRFESNITTEWTYTYNSGA